jgi:hypothetical protein
LMRKMGYARLIREGRNAQESRCSFEDTEFRERGR